MGARKISCLLDFHKAWWCDLLHSKWLQALLKIGRKTINHSPNLPMYFTAIVLYCHCFYLYGITLLLYLAFMVCLLAKAISFNDVGVKYQI